MPSTLNKLQVPGFFREGEPWLLTWLNDMLWMTCFMVWMWPLSPCSVYFLPPDTFSVWIPTPPPCRIRSTYQTSGISKLQEWLEHALLWPTDLRAVMFNSTNHSGLPDPTSSLIPADSPRHGLSSVLPYDCFSGSFPSLWRNETPQHVAAAAFEHQFEYQQDAEKVVGIGSVSFMTPPPPEFPTIGGMWCFRAGPEVASPLLQGHITVAWWKLANKRENEKHLWFLQKRTSALWNVPISLQSCTKCFMP